MKLKNTILAGLSALALAATGCVGSLVDDGPSDNNNNNNNNGGVDAGVQQPEADAGTTPVPDTAQALFEQNVRPSISATCGLNGAGCHTVQTPAFVASDPTQAYTTIMNFKAILFNTLEATGSQLLAHGNGSHYGVTFDQGDIDAISAWLTAEKAAAEGGGGTQLSPLEEWSGCMDLTEWANLEVAQAWANKNAQGQGNCEACHNLGADGFMASDQYERVFNNVTQNPSFMLSYFTLNDTGTEVIINRARLEKVGNRLPPHAEHGGFDVDGDAMQRLQQFYDLTVQRKLAGQCGPPRFQ